MHLPFEARLSRQLTSQLIRQLQKQQLDNQQLTEMGTQSSRSLVLDPAFLSSLALSAPLTSVDPGQTEVHQLHSHSREQHRLLLDRVRAKKKYDCPHLVRIIDSHTVESINICSTVIKTYIVVEKPRSLAEEFNHRSSLGLGFDQDYFWVLIRSCCLGGHFLLQQGIPLARLSLNNIYTDSRGAIKIIDPEFTHGPLGGQSITQEEFLQDICEVVQKLQALKPFLCSKKLLEIIDCMKRKFKTLQQLKKKLQASQLNPTKTQEITHSSSSQVLPKTKRSKSKSHIRVLSGRKNSSHSCKSEAPSETRVITHYDSVCSYRCESEQADSNKQNSSILKNVQAISCKKPLKNQPKTKEQNQSCHKFPKKALLGMKRAHQRVLEPLTSQYINKGWTFGGTNSPYPGSTRSQLLDSEPSLEGSQLLHMVNSYQVDHETRVRELGPGESYYCLELMNLRPRPPACTQ